MSCDMERGPKAQNQGHTRHRDYSPPLRALTLESAVGREQQGNVAASQYKLEGDLGIVWGNTKRVLHHPSAPQWMEPGRENVVGWAGRPVVSVLKGNRQVA